MQGWMHMLSNFLRTYRKKLLHDFPAAEWKEQEKER